MIKLRDFGGFLSIIIGYRYKFCILLDSAPQYDLGYYFVRIREKNGGM
jgi:hypothetical protein